MRTDVFDMVNYDDLQLRLFPDGRLARKVLKKAGETPAVPGELIIADHIRDAL